MINITDEQKDILKPYFYDLDKSLNDIDSFLDELDDIITENGFNENYELTDEGLKLQIAYDQIYNQN